MKLYTTGEAAKRAGVSRQTLQAWIDAGKVTPPRKFGGGTGVRLWSEADVAKLAKVKRRAYPRKKRVL